jgi:hypothetical protein
MCKRKNENRPRTKRVAEVPLRRKRRRLNVQSILDTLRPSDKQASFQSLGMSSFYEPATPNWRAELGYEGNGIDLGQSIIRFGVGRIVRFRYS